jgi:hypothetical protein
MLLVPLYRPGNPLQRWAPTVDGLLLAGEMKVATLDDATRVGRDAEKTSARAFRMMLKICHVRLLCDMFYHLL